MVKGKYAYFVENGIAGFHGIVLPNAPAEIMTLHQDISNTLRPESGANFVAFRLDNTASADLRWASNMKKAKGSIQQIWLDHPQPWFLDEAIQAVGDSL